jgi:hypothetical protein
MIPPEWGFGAGSGEHFYLYGSFYLIIGFSAKQILRATRKKKPTFAGAAKAGRE